jgi:hypothetical protein
MNSINIHNSHEGPPLPFAKATLKSQIRSVPYNPIQPKISAGCWLVTCP